MSDQTSVHLDTTQLDRLAASLHTNVEAVIRAFAFEVESEAKTLAPYETGALENSIYTNVQGGGGSRPAQYAGRNYEDIPQPSGDVIAVVGSGIEYAAYQELGTCKMASHPYLGPAVEDRSHDLSNGAMWDRLFK